MSEHPDRPLSRRTLLQRGLAAGGTLALGPHVLRLAACSLEGGGGGADIAADVGTGDNAAADIRPSTGIPADDVLLGLFPATMAATGAEVVRLACQSLDFGWLAAGDSVLVKVTCNSGNPAPMVTDPEAVRGIVAELFDRGAGRVLVADQAGIIHARLAPGDQRYASTRQRAEENGILAAITDSGAEAHFFDEHGYDAGYMPLTLPEGHHWSAPPLGPRILADVDHVVCLPRLGAHLVAGHSLGLKNAVGYLRDDSRFLLHNEAATFYEKIAELSYTAELAQRLRLTLTLASLVLLDAGPDDGTVYVTDPPLVIASGNIAHHDALAASLLVYFDQTIPKSPTLLYSYDPSGADFLNRSLVQTLARTSTGIPWGPTPAPAYEALEAHDYTASLVNDRTVQRALELAGSDRVINVHERGVELDGGVREGVERHGGGGWKWV